MNYKTNCLRTECSQGQVKGFSGKDLLQLSNGTVKVVRIEPMSVYPEHVHPDKTEYAFVMEGKS
jgi:quercetin dioxygenase-like cupin family protein